MRFSEIIGQEQLKQRLVQTVRENRISHAQLIVGMEGTGTLPLAIAYATYVSCDNKSETDSCGTCSSCLKMNKLVHPDLHLVFPVVNTSSIPKAVSDNYVDDFRKAFHEQPYMNLNMWIERISSENKQGGIFERESDEITRKLSLKTYEAEYKIMIIWMAEKMNITTSNKLLKLLEEPPQKTLFLLIAENFSTILPTILSRCQLVKVPSITEECIVDALQNNKVELEKAKHIAHLASGNYLKALEQVSQQEDNKVNFELFIKLMRHCYQVKVPEMMQWVEEVAALGREKQKQFLMYAINMLRENFTLNLGLNEVVYLNDQENDFSKKFSAFINANNIFSITEEMNKAFYHIESNANAKILFFDLALKLSVQIRNYNK